MIPNCRLSTSAIRRKKQCYFKLKYIWYFHITYHNISFSMPLLHMIMHDLNAFRICWPFLFGTSHSLLSDPSIHIHAWTSLQICHLPLHSAVLFNMCNMYCYVIMCSRRGFLTVPKCYTGLVLAYVICRRVFPFPFPALSYIIYLKYTIFWFDKTTCRKCWSKQTSKI